MGKVKSARKKDKSKPEKEKKLAIGPKLRLEPTLKPKPSPSKSDKIEETEKLVEENSCEIGYQDASFSHELFGSLFEDDIDEPTVNSETSTSGCAASNNAENIDSIFDQIDDSAKHYNPKSSVVGGGRKASLKIQGSSSQNIIKTMTDFMNKNKESLNKIAVSSVGWSNRELMDLAIGLQSKGFADLKAVADCVKTKKEDEIRQFLKLKIYDAHRNQKPSRGRPTTRFHTKVIEAIKPWPNIRKWRRIAFNQMLSHCRRMDYSKPAMEALCKKFYDEEKEPTDPEVINVKLIYKYMMDCMAGQIPAQLPPKESTLVLELLRETRLIPITFDFENERKFLNDFREVIKFRPFKVKDEFIKEIKDDSCLEFSGMKLPESIFCNLSRHKKTIQGFNPLITPIYLIQQEQEYLEEYYRQSNVYVD